MILRQAKVFKTGAPAGVLQELEDRTFRFEYLPEYQGRPVSLSMPIQQREWRFDQFPPFFDGLLPEGLQLQSLLKIRKLDRSDFFGQLLAVGQDLIGDVTLESL
jgi:serine/threonine-protein kinase HipA